MGLEEWYFGYLKNAFIPRYLLTLYRVHRVYHVSFYSHFVQNKQSFITKKYSLYIVGEVRGAEAIDMLQAFNTGHDGSLSTGHANSPRDMLSRLETMVLMGMSLPLPAVQRQISSGIDILIHLGRQRDKSRKVLEVTEVLNYSGGEIHLNPLYVYEGEEYGKTGGSWKRVHALVHKEKLMAAGYQDRGTAGNDT